MNAAARLVLIIVIPALVAFATYLIMRDAFLAPANKASTETVLIEVEPGKTFHEVAKLLEAKGVVRHWWSLELLARMRKSDRSINAGEYELTAAMEPRAILKKLASGEVYRRKITLQEGISAWEVGKLVEAAGLMSLQEFDSALADPKLLAAAGIAAPSFEGYLFPETYFFSRPITAKEIIWRMLEEGEKRWPLEFSARADELQLSRHEIITLASIIEKESGNVEEQPLISSVFHNRLSQGMKLQSDPTVIYGIPNFNGNLTREDLQTPSPYNTYMNFGLPPGPIASPGETAIRAALFPQESSYLFFVADGTGKHVFSTTLQEHNEAVNLYQRSRRAQNRAPTPPVDAEGVSP